MQTIKIKIWDNEALFIDEFMSSSQGIELVENVQEYISEYLDKEFPNWNEKVEKYQQGNTGGCQKCFEKDKITSYPTMFLSKHNNPCKYHKKYN